MSKLVDLVEFNPSVRLKKGEAAAFIEMAALPTNARDIPEVGTRDFSGSGSKFENGDTLFARITPCLENGKGGYVSTLRPGTAGHGSTEFIVLRARTRSDSLFVYYLTREPEFRRFAEKQMSGTSGRQRVAWQALAEYDLPEIVPAQRAAIGATLGALDDKIELNRKMNATLEAMARALFRDWFVDFGPTRAKMESRAPYLSPDLWSLFPERLDDEGKPEGWTVGTLGTVATARTEGVDPSAISPDTPYIGLEHMPRGSIALTDWEAADKVSSNKAAFATGDFLFGKLRPYFHKVGVAPISGICSTDIVVVRPKSAIWSGFVIACISDEDFIRYTDKTSTGTKMPRTSWSIMAKYAVALPPANLAEAFNATVAPMLDRIRANIQESRTLAQTRDLLLPRLMSGELRVAKANSSIEAVS